MDPQRVGSVRSGRSLRRKSSFASFRDDTKLVTVSYNKTVAAKAPIPILGGNTTRSSRPASAASSGTTPRLCRSSSRSGTIVVVSPPLSIQPPTEQHPALRTASQSKAITLEEWKRDSGHASATTSTSATIREECDEDGTEISTGEFPFEVHQGDRGASVTSEHVERSPSMLECKSKDSLSIYSQCSNRSGPTKTPDSTTNESKHGQRCTGTVCACAPSPAAGPTINQAVSVPLNPSYSGANEVGQRRGSEQLIGSENSLANEAPSVAAERTSLLLPRSLIKRFGKPSLPRPASSPSSPCAPQQTSFDPPRAAAMKLQKKRRNNHSRRQGDLETPQQGEQQMDEIVNTKVGVSTPQQGGLSEQWGLPGEATVGSDAKPRLEWPVQAPSPKAPNLRDINSNDQGPCISSSIVKPSPPLPPTAAPSSSNNTTIASRLWPRRSRRCSRSSVVSASSPQSRPASPEPPFASLSEINIDTDALLDHEFIASLSFSKRGSIMFGGKLFPSNMDRATGSNMTAIDTPTRADIADEPLSSPEAEVFTAPQSRRPSAQDLLDESTTAAAPVTKEHVQTQTPSPSLHVPKRKIDPENLLKPPPGSTRVLAADVEKESQKVRSLYAVGDTVRWEDGSIPTNGERLETTPEIPAAEENATDVSRLHLSPGSATPKSASSSSRAQDDSAKRESVLGGLEDWDNLDGAEVDRYGFITTPRPSSARLGTPTEMKSVQFSPRRGRNVLHKRDPAHYSASLSSKRAPSRKVSARSLNTVNSEVSFRSMRSTRSVVRQAGNLLPYNRDRRWMDEAGDMLAVSPSLQDVAEEARMAQITDALKKKEWDRAEKWRKMAKARKGVHGEGMEFEFDTKNPKLIERTWKGIPDVWRAAAWWSFMATSAKNHPDSPLHESIVADFYRLQDLASPDDVQIDLDVPRTISRHIMFRRRYRGGQRLLFRVLHAISIYYPQTGYVQGMASLAATLLSYFDEEKTFVMLVRMWQLRGLDRLYRPGFEGLMAALNEFETNWINKDVAKKLAELCVDSTAYGTRWYLTLFNLSIPFPAQLRVWDVFLLLGDTASDHARTAQNMQASKNAKDIATTPGTGLDILHAASAALVQALREVLLDSEFENAMRALTSFIPIKDEELLMKVAKAEWKTHQGKKKS